MGEFVQNDVKNKNDTCESSVAKKGRIKMKLKRFVSVVAALAITATAAVGLSGCGKGGTEEGGELLWVQVGDKPEAYDEVMAEANKIIQEEIGVTLNIEYLDTASFNEKMKLKMASGEPYDLAFVGYCNNYETAMDMGGLYDITELVEEVNLKEVMPEFYIDAARINGKLGAIPNIQVMSHPETIVFPKDLADEIGLDIEAKSQEMKAIKTFDDFKNALDSFDEIFAKAQAARPDKFTLRNVNWAASQYEGILANVSIKRDGSSDKLVLNYETDEYKYSAQKAHEWYNKGYIRKDIASLTNEGVSVESRKQYLFQEGSWKPGQRASEIKDYGYELAHINISEPYMSRTHPVATMIGVGANSKRPKKAVEFIKLINSNKDLYNLICFGIEGKNYTKNEDGTVTMIKGSGYDYSSGAWKFGNQFNALVLEGQEPTVWEETEKMNNEALKSPILGFVVDTSMIATEIGNMANTNSEYKAKTMGTVPFESWYDEYCEKMDQAGAHKVLEELQRQYDEWKAAK